MAPTQRVQNGVLSGLVVAVSIWLFVQAWRLHLTFHLNNYDLALAVRKLWGFRHFTFDNTIVASGVWWEHFDPVMLAVGGLSYLIPPVPLLLGLQVLAVGAVVLLLHRSASFRLSGWRPLLFSLAVLMNPALENAALAGFHALVLALPFLTLFLTSVDGRRIWRAFGWLLAALWCREETMGVLLVFLLADTSGEKKIRRIGWLVLFAWLLLVVLLTRHGSSLEFRLEGRTDLFVVPWLEEKLVKLVWMLAAFGFLAVAGWRRLIYCLPSLLLLVRSGWQPDFAFSFHYLSFYVPFLAFAALRGWQRLERKPRAWMRTAVPLVLLAGAGAAHYRYSKLPWGRLGSIERMHSDTFSREAAEVIGRISARESVAAPWRLAAHLADRREIYLSPKPGLDAVIVELQPLWVKGETAETYAAKIRKNESVIRTYVRELGYTQAFRGDTLCLLKKQNGKLPGAG